jgi:hypothetical protein
MLKVEGVAYDLKRDQEVHKRCLGALGLKIFYIFFEPSVIGKYGEKDVAGCQKGPKKIASETIKGIKKGIKGNLNMKMESPMYNI